MRYVFPVILFLGLIVLTVVVANSDGGMLAEKMAIVAGFVLNCAYVMSIAVYDVVYDCKRRAP